MAKRLRLSRLRAVALFAAAFAAAPAAAQPAPLADATSAQDLRELHAFARCVVLGRPERVRELLVLDPANETTSRQFGDLLVQANQCTNGRLGGGTMLFRGALAEALLARDLGGRSLAAATSFNPALPALQAHDSGDYMAMCVIRTSPAEVAAVFASAPGSSEERRAFDAAQPHLADCVPEGQSATVNRHGLRAALAMAGYRLVHHNANSAIASSDRR
jgi:hypothetical protein